MKRLSQTAFLITFVMLATATATIAQSNATQEIEETIRGFYKALSIRDAQGLQNTVDNRFVIVAAGRDNAKIGVLDANNPAAVLPPEGNNDWKDVRISSMTIQVSETHPTVATASFTLIQPLLERQIVAMKEALKQMPEAFSEAERAGAEKRITDRAIQNVEMAMLVRRNGKWKIVSISVPH